jgi:hypothetical protein
MRRTYVFIIMLVSLSVSGQLVDSLWFFFEDGAGNKDSVLYGSVEDGTPIPGRYLGADFNSFEEDFEVGIAKFFAGDNINPNDLEFCKHMIVSWKNGNKGSAFNQLYVRLKYPPLKMYYDANFFNKFDSRGAYITPDLRIELIPPSTFDGINRFECLYGQDTLVWMLGSDYMFMDALPIYKEANLTGGGTDTVWGLRHSDLYWFSQAFDTPCPYPVSTNDLFSEYKIELITNAPEVVLHNHGDFFVDQVRVISASGHVLSIFRGIIAPGQSQAINVGYGYQGLCIVEVQMETGTIRSQKCLLFR